MAQLCVLIPFYNEEEQLPKTLQAVREVLSTLPEDYVGARIIACDDGSQDGSWQALREQQQRDPLLSLLRFSRNFGKEAAIRALLREGLDEGADVLILMDGDLQHPPRYIPQMLAYWTQGYHIVDGVKEARQKESAFNRLAARSFYALFKRSSGLDLNNASDFKLLDRQAAQAYLSCPEHEPFFRALSAWIGFRRRPLPFTVEERLCGESKWSSRQLFRLSYQAFAAFSSKALLLIPWLCAAYWIFALILGLQTLIHWALGRSVSGFTTVILLLLLVGGSILLALSLIASYLQRICQALKQRPPYFLEERRIAPAADRSQDSLHTESEPSSAINHS